MEVANALVCGGGAALCGAVRRLAGCGLAPAEPAPPGDARPPGNYTYCCIILLPTSLISVIVSRSQTQYRCY